MEKVFKHKILQAINKGISESFNKMGLNIIDDDDDSVLVKSDKSRLQRSAEEHKTVGYTQLTDIIQVIEKILHISKIGNFKADKSNINGFPIYKSLQAIGQAVYVQLDELLKINDWFMTDNTSKIISGDREISNDYEDFIYLNANNEYYNFKNARYVYLTNDLGMVAIYYIDNSFVFLLTGKVMYEDCITPKEDLSNTPEYNKFMSILKTNYMSNPYNMGMMLKKDDDGKLYVETYWLRNLQNTKRKNYIAKAICKSWAESKYVKLSPNKKLCDFITIDKKVGAKLFVEKDADGKEIQGLRIFLID